MLVTLKEILADARKNAYAVPAFDCVEDVMVRTVLETCEELRAPVIIMCLAPRPGSLDMTYLAGMVRAVADSHSIPIALHLDHTSDLEIEKEDTDEDPYVAGGTIKYDVEVTNHGPSTATNVVLVDELPLGVHVIEQADPDFACAVTDVAAGNALFTCGLGTLAVGESKELTYEVRVDPDVADGTVLYNGACTWSDDFDPDNANNCDEEPSEITTACPKGQ